MALVEVVEVVVVFAVAVAVAAFSTRVIGAVLVAVQAQGYST